MSKFSLFLTHHSIFFFFSFSLLLPKKGKEKNLFHFNFDAYKLGKSLYYIRFIRKTALDNVVAVGVFVLTMGDFLNKTMNRIAKKESFFFLLLPSHFHP